MLKYMHKSIKMTSIDNRMSIYYWSITTTRCKMPWQTRDKHFT